MTTNEQLVAELAAAGALSASWRETFLAVARGRFIPARIWVWVSDGDRDGYLPLDYHSDPDRWRAAVYSNTTLVTQFDDGATVWPDVGEWVTSSASDPDVVAEMLDCLRKREPSRDRGRLPLVAAPRRAPVDPVAADHQPRSANHPPDHRPLNTIRHQHHIPDQYVS